MSERAKPSKPRQGKLKIDAPFEKVLRAALEVKPPEKPKRKPRRNRDSAPKYP